MCMWELETDVMYLPPSLSTYLFLHILLLIGLETGLLGYTKLLAKEVRRCICFHLLPNFTHSSGVTDVYAMSDFFFFFKENDMLDTKALFIKCLYTVAQVLKFRRTYPFLYVPESL